MGVYPGVRRRKDSGPGPGIHCHGPREREQCPLQLWIKSFVKASYHQTTNSKKGPVRSGAGRDDTMQRLFWLVLLMAFPAFAQTSLVLTWGPNPSNAFIWRPCSKSIKKLCRTGYTLTDVTAKATPVVITSTIAQDATTYAIVPLPSPGLHTYSLVVNAKDSLAKAVHSDPVTVTVTVPNMFSNPPAGFKAIATSTSIVFTWVGNQTKDLPVCSSKVKAACLTAYTLRDITTPSEQVSISASVGNVLSYTLNRLPESGKHTYSLVASGEDQNGTSRSSTPAIATVLVKGNP